MAEDLSLAMNWHDIAQCEGQWLKVARNQDGTVKEPLEFLNPTRKKIHDISGDLRYRFDRKILREGCYNIILEAAFVFRKKTEQARMQYREKLEAILTNAVPTPIVGGLKKRKRDLPDLGE